MPTYECKIRHDKIDEFKKNWRTPPFPEEWIMHVEAKNEGEAKIQAVELFSRTPIGDRTLGDSSTVENFSSEWFDCIELDGNQK
jgi:hypothetical protein